MDKILLLGANSAKDLGLFTDIEGLDDVVVKYPYLKRKSFKYIRKIVYTLSYLGIKVSMPKWIFDSNLEKWCIGCNKVLVHNIVLEFIPIEKIISLRAAGKKCYLFSVDSVDADSLTIKKTRQYFKKELWDEIITFDPSDAKKYDWSFIGWHFYSKCHLPKESCQPLDLYFVSGLKGNKIGIVNKVYEKLKSCHINCLFDIMTASKEEKEALSPGINSFRKSISYQEVLHRIAQSNCILEILQENQHAPSLRYFEAIFYNKKLLTTNKDIINYPLYNPKYMKVFSRPEDIDIDWLLKDESINYNYNGEFSPLRLIEHIRNQ